MENDGTAVDSSGRKWQFGPNAALLGNSGKSIRAVIAKLVAGLRDDGPRPVLPLGHGDPSVYPCFRTAANAVDAIVGALKSAQFNCYAPRFGVLAARRALAEHLSHELPYELSPDDVFLTAGCTQAIEILISVLSRPGANILLPRPSFPFYEARADICGLEVRHFDLLPNRNWEIDLDAVRELADENTVAIVMINPGNPCGNVFTYQHLAELAETANKLGILVIADEVYDHLAFGSNPFVPMGVFGKTVPVITVGSISKRWMVPGWRLGWIVTTDPNAILRETKIVHAITNLLNITTDPATFIQGAIPDILWNTKDDFFKSTLDNLRQAADLFYNAVNEINCMTCPNKPEGSMFAMVKLNLSDLVGISDDFDFCCQLAKEESVILLPGQTVGLKNWIRVTFAIEHSSLVDGLSRLKSFCQRHTKQDS